MGNGKEELSPNESMGNSAFRCHRNRPERLFLDISESVEIKWERTFEFPILSVLFRLLQIFREHTLEGSSLALLSESHLTGILGLKLGPAMRLLKAIRAL